MAKSFEEREREFFGAEYDSVVQEGRPQGKVKNKKTKKKRRLSQKSREVLHQIEAEEDHHPTRVRAALHPFDVDELVGFGRESLSEDLAIIQRSKFSMVDW